MGQSKRHHEIIHVIAVCLLCGWSGLLQAQPAASRYRVVFYNVENLFDTRNDTLTRDDDFTPFGQQRWTKERYHRKLRQLSDVLQAVGEGRWPALVGLAEVENRHVLEELCRKTALVDGGYRIVHADSPDPRGIDVALLYREADFHLLHSRFWRIPLGETEPTRDILYAKGVLAGTDTLHLFVAHFPSMQGGERQSEWKRVRAAALLREKVDSLWTCDTTATLLVMGDLNGRANTRAQHVLRAKNADSRKIHPRELYNTGYYLLHAAHGSYYYQGEWQTIDHIIVSGHLLKNNRALRASPRLTVFRPAFLLEEDKKHFGYKPHRTYLGPRYLGGYSDHLPVYLDLFLL